MVLLGWVAMMLGAVLFFVSLGRTLGANPDDVVPYNRDPAVVPRHTVALRSAAVGLLVLAAVGLSFTTGPWPVAVPAVVGVIGMIVLMRHNRRAGRTDS